MRRTLKGGAALLCVVVLAACGGTTSGSEGGASKTPDAAGTLTFMDSAPNPNLDPTDPNNDSSFSQVNLYAVYDRLVGFDPDGTPVPQLATEWTLADDLTSVTLTLRDGVTFHDGQPLDSAAVKANLERSKSVGDAAGSTVRAAAAEIASVDTPDSSTVTINLTKPDGGFVYALGTQIGMMISPSSLDGSAGLDLDPVGAGPYVAEDFKPTDTATFARFDDYWDDSEERPAKFVVKYVTDATTRLNAVRSGQSTVSLITPSQLSTAESSGLEVVVNPTSSRWTLYLNTSRVMKDERIRQAMMYAIDRESIASALSFDTGEPTVSLIPGGAPGSIEDAEADYPYDVEKAKELMSEAGYPDGGLTISYILLNSPEYSQLTDVLQEQLAAIGIKLDVSQIDISQAASFTAGTGDMMLARWGGRADQLATLNVVVGPDGTYAPGGVVTPELEQALQQAGQFSIDDPQRAVALQDANQETISQAATVPIMTRANIYAFKPGCVAGLEEYLASGSNDWRDVTVSSGC